MQNVNLYVCLCVNTSQYLVQQHHLQKEQANVNVQLEKEENNSSTLYIILDEKRSEK